jgi:hypothetical protein
LSRYSVRTKVKRKNGNEVMGMGYFKRALDDLTKSIDCIHRHSLLDYHNVKKNYGHYYVAPQITVPVVLFGLPILIAKALIKAKK